VNQPLNRLEKLLSDANAAADREGGGDAKRGEQSKKLGEFETVAAAVVAPALESVARMMRAAGHSAEIKNSGKSPASPSGYPEVKISLEIALKGVVGASVLMFSNHGSSQVLVGAVLKNKGGSSEMRSANSFPIASLTPKLVETLAVDFVEEALSKGDLI
jgi:hypothetical protein